MPKIKIPIGLTPAGTYTGKLPNGSYTADVYASIYGQTLSSIKTTEIYNIGNATVNNAPATANFTIPAMTRLTGKVTVPGITPLPDGSLVSASDQAAPKPQNIIANLGSGGGFGSAEGSGNHELILAANHTYAANAQVPVLRDSETAGYAFYPLMIRTVSLGAGHTLDFNFPALPAFVRFIGRVTDSSGRPVSKAIVGAYSASLSGAPDLGYSGSAQTDASGNYEIYLLRGVEYTFYLIRRGRLHSCSRPPSCARDRPASKMDLECGDVSPLCGITNPAQREVQSASRDVYDFHARGCATGPCDTLRLLGLMKC